MAERMHTIVCIFDSTSPRISAYEIHEWFNDQLQVEDHSLTVIKIDGKKGTYFIHMYRTYCRLRRGIMNTDM